MFSKQIISTFQKFTSAQSGLIANHNVRSLFLTSQRQREVVDRREMLRSVPKLDEGSAGEKAFEVDALIHQKTDIFPDADTPNRLFNGIPFKNLPIMNIRVSPNNTIITMTDDKGAVKLLRSCGIEGFKNTRKGTNIAAQATAITIGTKVLERGIKTVRVRVRGLGPGRMSAIKGLQMSGLEIVSITDSTPVSWNPPRPRKAKKL
ncbi:small ribosomal subunit protein uS11 [Tribolium castaneum]|uniref:28S ribosomal protein S11, mitochondrial-like Protein n=1 Tax=Tribolium castaneum TaxID=7070 RepID=A0A139WEL6_TRICA|nr:PREDICTED: 30S ribosomal protein S11 [Tribolium castaneum]KYB26418.1 28S ribosomal protein S11, mitochondrial-like Protein [Tribolium castaneum]|eukprot:XP_975332.1 PREDICTED: 30S ribosomal protein S11 [Tribolium castaneum]